MADAAHNRAGSAYTVAHSRERRTAQGLVLDSLREAILTGKIRGGSRLVQEKISTRLNVSRIPVREALLQLEAEGLVRLEPHRGATVVWLSPKEINELSEIRLILMTAAVRQVVPHLVDDQVDRLEKIAQKEAVETRMAARSRLNRAFYSTLFERLDRPRLIDLMDKLERELVRYLVPWDRPPLGHVEIAEACRRRDTQRVVDLLSEHLEAVRERAVQQVESLSEPGLPASTPRRPSRRVRATAAAS
jgi:DNA-binding GntR family transcriptional regulator